MSNSAWSCLPMAFSKALNIPFEKMIEYIGHDGSASVYKNSKYRRGFHFQECIDVALKLKVACVPIEHHYALTPDGLETYQIGDNNTQSKRFIEYLTNTEVGVLEGLALDKDQVPIGHAATWMNQHILDPRGLEYQYDVRHLHNFCVIRLWRFIWF